MFSVSEEGNNAVYVGIPVKKKHLTGDATALTSKIGGVPLWHNAAVMSNSFREGKISCRVCGRDSTMVFVGQIYSPVNFDRSLYIFCCNTRNCSLSSKGWLVFRNQKGYDSRNVHETTHSSSLFDNFKELSNLTSTGDESNSKSKITKPKASTDWVNLLADAALCNGSRNETNSLGSESRGFDTPLNATDDLGDLEALLATRDASLALKSGTASNALLVDKCNVAATVDDHASTQTSLPPPPSAVTLFEDRRCRADAAGSGKKDIEHSPWLLQQLNEIHIEAHPEHWRLEDKRSYKRSSEVSDDDDEEDDIVKNAVTDDHIERMLQSYLTAEEDTRIVDMLRSRHNPTSPLSDATCPVDPVGMLSQECSGMSMTMIEEEDCTEETGNDDSDEEGKGEQGEEHGRKSRNDHRSSSASHHSPTSTIMSASKSSMPHDAQNKVDSRLERSDRRSKVESYFQWRVAKEPSQIMRYAYGGEPLWCTYPPPDHIAEIPSVEEYYGNKSRRSLTPKDGEVPCCEGCGSQRVFELQLMPALLSLPIFPSQSKGTTRAGGPSDASASCVEGGAGDDEIDSCPSLAGFLEKLGDTMDFGVVAIWSCPNSCEESQFEYVVVQTPPDIGL